METALLEIAKQVPSLLVLVWLVVQQNRANEKRDTAFIAALGTRDAQLAAQAATCHAEASAGRAAITENTRALARFDACLEDGGCVELQVRRAVREELRQAPPRAAAG